MSRSSDRGTEAGQALVEFALVVPLLLLLVVGVIEFGRAWNVSQAVNYAARQGARTAAVLNGQLPPSQIEDSVVAVVTDALGQRHRREPRIPRPDRVVVAEDRKSVV